MEENPSGGGSGLADTLLSVAEAARYLGVGTRSIYKMIHHLVDPLPVVRKKPYMIRRKDLDHRKTRRS